MEVYRITAAKYGQKLSASRAPNRWNGENQYVLYAAESRALAALEMVAHRSSKMRKNDFKILAISLPDPRNVFEEMPVDKLPINWRTMMAYNQLQRLGGEWYRSKRKLILRVPSVLVDGEYNYIINTNHPDFEKHVVLKTVKDFQWDNRLF